MRIVSESARSRMLFCMSMTYRTTRAQIFGERQQIHFYGGRLRGINVLALPIHDGSQYTNPIPRPLGRLATTSLIPAT